MNKALFIAAVLCVAASAPVHSKLSVKGKTILIEPMSGLVMNYDAPNSITPGGSFSKVPSPRFVVTKAGKYVAYVYVCTATKTDCYRDKHAVTIK